MSLPRTNNQSQSPAWVNSAPADTSFVTGIAVLHEDRAAVEVIYTGLDAADATIRLKASNSNDINRARNLTDDVCTMTTANSSILFNIKEMGFTFLHAEYDAGSNTAGAVTVHLSRKQKS